LDQLAVSNDARVASSRDAELHPHAQVTQLSVGFVLCRRSHARQTPHWLCFAPALLRPTYAELVSIGACLSMRFNRKLASFAHTATPLRSDVTPSEGLRSGSACIGFVCTTGIRVRPQVPGFAWNEPQLAFVALPEAVSVGNWAHSTGATFSMIRKSGFASGKLGLCS
jgi:hypothetical protein